MKSFDIFKFKKEVSTRTVVDNYEQVIIASVWEFIFNYVNNQKRELVQFALDSGLGERNSLGFGFMNKIE
jgi:CRISPR-associated endoribonuclease Cas6